MKKNSLSHSLVRFLHYTKLLARAADWLAAALLAAIIVVNILSIVSRYVFTSPIGWGEEFMRYAIIWAVFIAASATFRHGEQMVIDLIDLVPSVWVRRIAAFASLVATLTLAAIVLTFGFPYLLDTGQVSPSMRIPMWFPYSAVVIGYALIAIQAVAAYLESFIQQPIVTETPS